MILLDRIKIELYVCIDSHYKLATKKHTSLPGNNPVSV